MLPRRGGSTVDSMLAVFRRLVACAALLALGACGGAGASRPNVLFISIDSLRADHLASYGYDRVTSPNLDRLADEGVLFETVVAESSWTLPTHASMFTGLTSRVHGVDRNARRLAPDAQTLGTIFQRAGYRTRGVFSGPYLHTTFGFGGGFAPGDWSGVEEQSPLDAMSPEEAGAQRRETLKDAHGLSHQSITSPAVTAQAESFLAGVGEEPFFLFLHYFDVHFDYIPPEEYWRRFDPDYAGDHSPERFLENPDIRPDMPAEELAHVLARYDGEILWVDEHIGRVLAALEEHGLGEDTLVMVTSDHGDEFFEHGRTGHRHTLYDEVLLVPLIARHPGRTATRHRVSGVVRHIDLLPTLLDWVGLPVPESAMGTSLAGALRGEPLGADLAALSRLHKPSTRESFTTLRHSDWKWLERTQGGAAPERQVFDLSVDPAERVPRREDPRVETGALQLQALEVLEQQRAGNLDGQEIEVPADIEAELRALGYLGDEEE